MKPPKPPKASEAEFQSAIADAAHALGYAVAHFRAGMNRRGQWQTPGRYEAVGFPDLLCVRQRTPVLAIEVKGPRTPIKPEQIVWLTRFAESGHGHGWLFRSGKDDIETIVGWLAKPDQAPTLHLP